MPQTMHYTKINSKLVIDLKVKHRILKRLGENLCDLGLDEDFFS